MVMRNPNAIVYLVQNRKFDQKNKFGLLREKVSNRLDLLFISLRYLLHYLSPKEEAFDILIFHEGDLNEDHMEKIRNITQDITTYFERVHFQVPSWLNEEAIQNSIETSNIVAWRDMGYRHMCRFYSLQVYDLLLSKGYKKMMRFDDDSFLLQHVPPLFPIVTPSQPFRCRLMQQENIDYAHDYYSFFSSFLRDQGLGHQCPSESDDSFYNIPFNNFFVMDLSVHQQPFVKTFLHHVDRHGGIYYHRWGDALIQGTMLRYLCQIPIKRLDFQYSKWLHVYDPISFSHDDIMENFQHMSSSDSYYPSIIIPLLLVLLILCIVVGVWWCH